MVDGLVKATGVEMADIPEAPGKDIPGAMGLEEALDHFDTSGEAAAEGGADRPPVSPEAPSPQDGGQPRGEDGKFVSKSEEGEDGPVPFKEAIISEIPGEEDPEEEGEGETEAELESEEEPELESEEEVLEAEETVELKALSDEEETIELEIDDPEVAERIRGIQDLAGRADEYKGRAERAENDVTQVLNLRQQLMDVQEDIEDDPVGFITGTMPTAKRRAEVAVDLLLDDEVFAEVTKKIDEWIDNPISRKEERLDRKTERQELEQTRRVERGRRSAAMNEGKRIVSEIKSFIPDDMETEIASRFERDMIRDFREWLDANGQPSGVPTDKVREILEYRVKQYGVELSENGKGPVVAWTKIAKAKREVKRIKKSRQSRRAVAASAPVGSGTPVTSIRPAAGASLDEALETVEKLVSGR